MALLISASMFFVSFSPLWLSVIFIDVMSISSGVPNIWTEYLSIGAILFFFIISVIIMMIGLNPMDTQNAQPFTIVEAKDEKAITSEFLLSYILPLFAFDFTRWQQVTLFLLFFMTLAFLCVRHNYYSVNIVLELLGYRFYRCDLENEDSICTSRLIISKFQLNGHKSKKVLLRSLNNEYSLCLKLGE